MARYLAIDWGEKRIGLALSDPTGTIASPLATLPNRGLAAVIEQLQALIAEHQVSQVVVGLPKTMGNRFSRKTEEVAQVIEKLEAALPVPVVSFDERLTTVLAHQTVQQMGKKPSRQRDKIDQLAAVHLLQSYLDWEKSGGRK
ncbi:MAG: Holliday junction resolvase RuvX [Calditrichaeota bacterium]|nr:MAG: Holliday junction resolvase RuvX [Calditrichota bacterium]